MEVEDRITKLEARNAALEKRVVKLENDNADMKEHLDMFNTAMLQISDVIVRLDLMDRKSKDVIREKIEGLHELNKEKAPT